MSTKFFCTLALTWALIASPVVCGAAKKATEATPQTKGQTITGTDVIFPGKLFASLKRIVTMPYAGIVQKVYRMAGTPVTAGESLFDYSLELSTRNGLLRSLSPPSVSAQELKLAEMSDTLDDLDERINQTAMLIKENMAPTSSLAGLEKRKKSLQDSRKIIEKNLAELYDVHRERIAMLRKELHSDKVRSNYLPDTFPMPSPIDGHVLWLDENVREQGQVSPGSPVCVVGVMDPMIIRGQVFEMEASKLKVGDSMRFQVESMPGRMFPATVSRISWIPMDQGLAQPSYYEVELTCPNPEILFREGFKVQVSY